jgi:hypothetical protein
VRHANGRRSHSARWFIASLNPNGERSQSRWHGQVERASSPTSAATMRRCPPGPGLRWRTTGRSYAPDPAAVASTVSQAVDCQPRSPVTAPTTADTLPTTTITADARSGRALRSVDKPAAGTLHPCRYGVRSQASAGISLHLPSARRSAVRDGPEQAGTPSDGGSRRQAVCARHGR